MVHDFLLRYWLKIDNRVSSASFIPHFRLQVLGHGGKHFEDDSSASCIFRFRPFKSASSVRTSVGKLAAVGGVRTSVGKLAAVGGDDFSRGGERKIPLVLSALKTSDASMVETKSD